MDDLQKVKSDSFEAINKYPQCEGDINEAYEMMMDEIQDGESEDNEIEHFYSRLSDIIETTLQDHIRGKIVKEHK
jgi:hypothetical protein